jgi:hypothetical protein
MSKQATGFGFLSIRPYERGKIFIRYSYSIFMLSLPLRTSYPQNYFLFIESDGCCYVLIIITVQRMWRASVFTFMAKYKKITIEQKSVV